jgi:hypothetical protein
MGFNYTNGFHDAANAIATSVSTRGLDPRIALVMAAVFNLFGAFIGTKVADTVGKGIIDPPSGTLPDHRRFCSDRRHGMEPADLVKGCRHPLHMRCFAAWSEPRLPPERPCPGGCAGQDRHPDGDLACAGAHPWILRDDHHLVDLPPPPPRACDTPRRCRRPQWPLAMVFRTRARPWGSLCWPLR